MARDIDLGPLPDREPDRVGVIQLRAKPERRRITSNPDGMFVELKNHHYRDAPHPKVMVHAYVKRSRIRWIVGLERGGEFVSVRDRADPHRAVCCAIHICVMVGLDSVHIDAGDRCSPELVYEHPIMYMDEGDGGYQVQVDVSDLAQLDTTYPASSGVRLVVHPEFVDTPEGLEPLLKRRCGVRGVLAL